jgi:hypothetical protein
VFEVIDWIHKLRSGPNMNLYTGVNYIATGIWESFYTVHKVKKKSKAIPVTGRGGL